MENDIAVTGSDRQLLVRGVFAALTIARDGEGVVDLKSFSHHIGFLSRSGLQGFVVNGATGEFCLTPAAELGQMISVARDVLGRQGKLIAAIGGASTTQVMQRLAAAERAGADAVLLPMPYFFPYAQQDLVMFVQMIAAHTSLPLLLYNLPAFTTPLEPETTLALLSQSAQGGSARIAGIKDSSGSLDTVRLLKARLPFANRVIGNDGALYGSLAEGLCDGVVSGIACVLPELIQVFYKAASHDATDARTIALKNVLEEFIDWLGRFPVPWGLKMIAMERGLSGCDLPLPLSSQRATDRQLFLDWFRDHRGILLAEKTYGIAL